jgi:AbrB family looped-hinge helix DNA binding protein
MDLPKTATVTSKLQLTIPMTIAKKLRLRVGDKVNVTEHNGRVIVRPYKKLIEDLAGSLRSS